MGLSKYRTRRDFARTPEPAGRRGKGKGGRRFVIQKHAARRLHYDFRLEHGGVLWSWAVPKGPSLDPKVKRLAVQTEDHPVEYGDFEGVIPKGEYGGGTVLLWDRGTWTPVGDPEKGYAKGHLEFALEGEKLEGRWHLVRTSRGEAGAESWLLFKAADASADPRRDPVTEAPHSVATGRGLEEIAQDGDRVWDRGGERRAPRRRRKATDPSRLEGAREARLPRSLRAPVPREDPRPPVGDDWLHELDREGMRVLLRRSGEAVHVVGTEGEDPGPAVEPIRVALGALPLGEAWLLGTLVVLRADGRGDRRALGAELRAGRRGRVVCFVSDLAYLDGYDLRRVPLRARKALLAERLASSATGPLRYERHLEGTGSEVLEKACGLGAKAILSRRGGSTWRGGLSGSWRRTPCPKRKSPR